MRVHDFYGELEVMGFMGEVKSLVSLRGCSVFEVGSSNDKLRLSSFLRFGAHSYSNCSIFVLSIFSLKIYDFICRSGSNHG